jgi:hypothetical protein
MNFQLQQVFIDPIGAIRLVGRQLQRPGKWLSVVVEQAFIGADQQRFQGSRLVRLAGREMEMQRVTMRIAQQMNFARKSPAGAT